MFASTVDAPAFQPSLLATGPVSAPPTLDLNRIDLGSGAWLDHRAGLMPGADDLAASLMTSLPWQSSTRAMYERMVDVPRLTCWLERADDEVPEALTDLSDLLSDHYDRPMRTLGCNWYRDGADSVAWHSDRVERPGDAVVAILALGTRRPLLLRPKLGGASSRWELGHGDLLVMGGTCQAFFEHAVPKLSRPIGPRVSVVFRG